MANVTVDDIRPTEGTSALDATAQAVRVRTVDASGADRPASTVTVSSVPSATGTANVATTQVTTDPATSQVAVAARAGRSLVHLKNIDPTNTIYISETSPASPVNSYWLLPNEDAWYPTSAALYCRAGAGTPVLSVVEFY